MSHIAPSQPTCGPTMIIACWQMQPLRLRLGSRFHLGESRAVWILGVRSPVVVLTLGRPSRNPPPKHSLSPALLLVSLALARSSGVLKTAKGRYGLQTYSTCRPFTGQNKGTPTSPTFQVPTYRRYLPQTMTTLSKKNNPTYSIRR